MSKTAVAIDECEASQEPSTQGDVRKIVTESDPSSESSLSEILEDDNMKQ